VAQSYGLAGFESNTVVMGWGHQEDRAHDYGNLIYDLTDLGKGRLRGTRRGGPGYPRYVEREIRRLVEFVVYFMA
jgi:hypothetical protein